MGCTVVEAQARVGACEFVEWQIYWDMDMNQFHREDYNAATIARTVAIRGMKPADARKVKLDQFLVKFEKKGQAEAPLTGEQKRVRMEKSKMAWRAVLMSAKPRLPPNAVLKASVHKPAPRSRPVPQRKPRK